MLAASRRAAVPVSSPEYLRASWCKISPSEAEEPFWLLFSAGMAGERIRLEVQEREQRGTSESRRLRRAGMIPGVLYGNGKKPHPICVPER